MPSDHSSEVKFEIGHVLFIDIVGYSKLLLDEQKQRLRLLTDIVLNTSQVKESTNEQLVKLPTGDGMALVFRNSPEGPLQCALEVARKLKAHPEVSVRMGIHSGPVSEVVDLNQRSNVAGAGINLAQRVMDCGDTGHILLSKRVADDLEQFGRWQPHLHPIGECEVKHGVRVGVANFYNEEIGNRQLPGKFQLVRKRRARMQWGMAAATLLLVGAMVAAFVFVSRRAAQFTAPEQSIAVLPFENLIRDPENAFLSTGIQDEILTRLSKISALKVISRSSTKHYESNPANLSEVGKQLGVANILEGSVQKVGAKIRVNVQLIKASSDAHLWADTFDRELIDVLAVESQIASEIAAALRATLTPEEKARVDEIPTDNSEAYALYLRAGKVLDQAADLRAPAEEALTLFEKATALDPKFAAARIGAANMALNLYLVFEPRPEFKTKAWAEIQEALRLDPNMGEAHEALGAYYDRIDLNYEAAEKEYAIARRALPNNSTLIRRIGLMHRRQGRWREGLAEVERAAELDPRSITALGWLSGTYQDLRNWRAAEEMERRCLAVALTKSPEEVAEFKIRVGLVHFWGTGNDSLLRQALAEAPADLDPGGLFTLFRYWANMYLHDFDAAEKTLERSPLTVVENGWGAPVAKSFLQGCVASARGDSAKARPFFEAALPHAEKEVKEHPETANRHAQLGTLYAYLGRKEEALREGSRAQELLPESKDAYYGVDISNMVAVIYSRLGDADQAIPLIERLLRTPRGQVLQDLRSSPDWDPLRKDPRFQKILTTPEPKVTYN